MPCFHGGHLDWIVRARLLALKRSTDTFNATTTMADPCIVFKLADQNEFLFSADELCNCCIVIMNSSKYFGCYISMISWTDFHLELIVC